MSENGISIFRQRQNMEGSGWPDYITYLPHSVQVARMSRALAFNRSNSLSVSIQDLEESPAFAKSIRGVGADIEIVTKGSALGGGVTRGEFVAQYALSRAAEGAMCCVTLEK